MYSHGLLHCDVSAESGMLLDVLAVIDCTTTNASELTAGESEVEVEVPKSEKGVVMVHACTRVGESEAAEMDVAEAEADGMGKAESVGEAEGVSTGESDDEMPTSVGDTDGENESVASGSVMEAIVELCAEVEALSATEADGDCEALENTS